MAESRYRVRLLRWSESSSGGRTVTFQLPDDHDEHPFKGLPTGKRDGALLEIAVRMAADEAAPLETLSPATPTPTDTPLEPVAPRPRPRVRSNAGAGTDADRAAAPAPAHEPTPGADDGPAAGNAPEGDPTTGPASPADPHAGARVALQAMLRTAVEPRTSSAKAPAPEISGGNVAVAAAEPSADDRPGGGGAGAGGAGDSDLTMHAMAQAALDMRRAAVEIAGDRGGGEEDEADKGGVVERAVTLCKEVDHQRAGFFYYMKTRYPTVPELPPEIGQGAWSRDAHATRNRVCLHCETQALAELGLDPRAETRFEDLEADYERAERNR